LALVINAVSGWTQNQLHIHLSCLKPDVARLLRDHMDQIGLTWKPLSFRLLGYRVLARRLNGAGFGAQDPFKILADGVHGAHDAMGTRSLAAVGVVFPDGSPGFVLLSHTASPATGDIGVGEDILDYSCGILGPPAPPAG
jgi:CDP-diacylglycerol pyrophosphatase